MALDAFAVLLQFSSGFFSREYFGNAISQYVVFLAIVGISVLVAKAADYLIKNWFRRLADKSSNKFDDLVLDVIEKPLVLAIVIAGIFIGYHFLSFPDAIDGIFRNIIQILYILVGAWLAMRFVDALIKEYLEPLSAKTESKLDDQLIPILRKVVKAAILTIAFIIILSNFGYDVTALIAGLGIGGLAVAFAAQATIADAFGGLSIFTSKPFLVGDIVKTPDAFGTVEEVGLRYTRIRTFDKRIVVVPNSKVAGGVIENVSSEPARRIQLHLGLTYATPAKKIRQAKEIILKIIKSNPGCSKGAELAPQVTFSEFKDYSLDLWAIYFVDKDNWIEVQGQVNEAIREEFEDAKIEFAFPTQTIHLAKK
ncbi:MAG: mechanosensitive ion channel family protein [Candidatus Diapherotrites archaeon]|nr:mechanosensitive ion channel family protein [Candidatus Diapherotrites archaeon]